jgi:hypothetical protein
MRKVRLFAAKITRQNESSSQCNISLLKCPFLLFLLVKHLVPTPPGGKLDLSSYPCNACSASYASGKLQKVILCKRSLRKGRGTTFKW